MITDSFLVAWPDYFDLVAEINWTPPSPRDLVISGNLDEDATAYFYSIVSRVDKTWWPYYIGMTYNQSVSLRLTQSDHLNRLALLTREHPNRDFSISLGTPNFKVGRRDRRTIEAIEGLLIYSNWHESMINDRKINRFSDAKQMYVRNVGWNEHVEPEAAYGVFYR